MSDYFSNLKQKLAGANTASAGASSEEKPATIQEVSKELIEPKEKPIIKEKIITPQKEKQFFLSQTLIKQVTNRNGHYNEVCPRAIYEIYIQRNYRHVTLPMLEGIYGETLLLGGGAKGQKVTDLPRHKKKGDKLTAQLNIEEQAIRFPIWCAEKGINIIPGVNTQVPIVKRFNNDILIATEIDLFPTPFLDKNQYKLAVMDIKFTSNIQTTYGNFSWGAPEFVDHIQADITYWLLKDFDMELNLKFNPEKEQIYKTIFENEAIVNMIQNDQIMFVYFIIGYKKQPLEEQKAFIYRSYLDPNGGLFRQNEWKERARKTMAQLSEWKKQNWPALENTWCKNCKVSYLNGGYCKHDSLQTV